MPIMDGYEATQRIREKEKECHAGKSRIPIIALSASAMKDDMERGMAHGMTDYLTKPVNLKILTSTLEACMG
jgi:CheY-like chemotaxis protein